MVSTSGRVAFPARQRSAHGELWNAKADLDLGRDVFNMGSSIIMKIKWVEMLRFYLVVGLGVSGLSDSVHGQRWAPQQLDRAAPLTLNDLAQTKQPTFSRPACQHQRDTRHQRLVSTPSSQAYLPLPLAGGKLGVRSGGEM